MRYCPLIRDACREDCAMLLPYNNKTLCSIPMIAHELFVVAEELSVRRRENENGEQNETNL